MWIVSLGNIIENQSDIFPIFQEFILDLLMQQTKKKLWSSQEIELLSHLHSQFTSKRWKRIAEEFRSRGLNRTETECREKWINFLDPKINRKEWQDWELRKLYEVHEQVGTRWCVIQKSIGRTQNKIKNHFYGTLRNYIRFVVSHYDNGQNCFNNQISHLPPSYLNSLYNSTEEFQGLGNEVKDAIYAMIFKIDKRILIQRIQERKELYYRLNQIILEEFARIKLPKAQDCNEENQPMREVANISNILTSLPSFNNQMNIPTMLLANQNVPQYPTVSWEMLPFMDYHTGMVFWYP